MNRVSAGSWSRLVIASAWVLGLAACETRPPVPAPPPPVRSIGEAAPIPEGAREYKVIAPESLLQVLVYRGGTLARLGHNHVIASHQLTGSVYAPDDLTHSRFDISFPVDGLTVDEPEMRAAAGPDFPPGVPQAARDGTRANLLSEALLDGANHPLIRLRAVRVIEAGADFDVDVEITIRNEAHEVRVPMHVERKDRAIFARGEFALRHSQLGLKPFSAAMGALAVMDEMRVRFEVNAREP